ncbi:hypothetical protein N0V85_003554 [Neurospora sp. IMI 360204]|nr:hypothetical protein N0V85_003554 [Neurospora sp. IMI 360204]
MTSPSPPIPPDTAATGFLGPFPTPTHGQPGAGSFTIACSARIKAAPRTCLEVLLKASEYPSWNRYCRKCTIDAQPDGDHHSSGASSAPSDQQALPNLVGPEFLRLGTKFTFHVHMDPLSEDSNARNTALEVSRLERIDEVVEANVSSVSGSAASLPRANASASAGGTGAGAGAGAAIGAGVAQYDSPDGGDGGGGGADGGGESQIDDDLMALLLLWKKADDKPTNPKEKDKAKAIFYPQTNNTNNNNKKLQLRRRTGFRIAWKTRPTLFMPNRMLRCERVQEFVQVYPPSGTLGEPETAYQCWETFYGVLAPVVKAAAGSQIMRGFDVWMEGLKKRAEGMEGRGK